jgi:hypothetical protein
MAQHPDFNKVIRHEMIELRRRMLGISQKALSDKSACLKGLFLK